jgi:hypothetical protein
MVALAAVLIGLAALVARPDAHALWTAGASRPLVDEWASYTEAGRSGAEITSASRPSRISDVSHEGRRAYQVRVLAHDRDLYTNNAQRTELGQGNPSRTFADGTGLRKMAAGDERWIAEAISIPRGAPTGDSGYGFFVVTQFKLDGPGGPAAALSFENDRLVVSRAESRASSSADQIDIGETPAVPRDRWLHVLWHVRWSSSGDGLIDAFADIDGKGWRRIAHYRGWTLKESSTGRSALVHPRIGIYRRTIRHDTTVYFSGFDVATTRDAAEADAGF